MISLVAFLGNYGSEYAGTRHNVAWLFEESLPFSSRLSWQNKFKGKFASVDGAQFIEWAENILAEETATAENVPQAGNAPQAKNFSLAEASQQAADTDAKPKKNLKAAEKIYFLKPETYMNLSGESIGELAHFFKIKPEEILVVHDELELKPGTISFKWSGGLGGHNGLRSTKATIGTADFWRLRFGIGRPNHPDVAGYVLSRFSEDERITLDIAFSKAAKLLAKALTSSKPDRLIKEWGKVLIG